MVRSTRLTRRADSVIKAMEGKGPVTCRVVCEITGLTSHEFAPTIRYLENEGKVRKAGRSGDSRLWIVI